MNKAVKVLLALVLTFAVLLIGSGVLLAASVVHSGVVTVKVDETGPEGKRMYIPVPAALISLGMDVIPLLAGEDIRAEIRSDLGEHREAVAAALLELENAPDAVLLHVQDAGENVRITKKGRTLEISVDNAEGSFEISVPARLIGRIAREIA